METFLEGQVVQTNGSVVPFLLEFQVGLKIYSYKVKVKQVGRSVVR
jgi:hypothetical protein